MVSLEFFIDIKSFRSHYGPGVDSASNRNEYQEYFLGVRKADNLTTLSRNLGTLTSWNLLGHSRPVTGLVYLTFTFFIPLTMVKKKSRSDNLCKSDYLNLYLKKLVLCQAWKRAVCFLHALNTRKKVKSDTQILLQKVSFFLYKNPNSCINYWSLLWSNALDFTD